MNFTPTHTLPLLILLQSNYSARVVNVLIASQSCQDSVNECSRPFHPHLSLHQTPHRAAINVNYYIAIRGNGKSIPTSRLQHSTAISRSDLLMRRTTLRFTYSSNSLWPPIILALLLNLIPILQRVRPSPSSSPPLGYVLSAPTLHCTRNGQHHVIADIAFVRLPPPSLFQ